MHDVGFLVGAVLYGTKQFRQKPNGCTVRFTGDKLVIHVNILTLSPRHASPRCFPVEKPRARQMDFTDDARIMNNPPSFSSVNNAKGCSADEA